MGKLTDMTERYLGKSTSTASLVTSKTASNLGLVPSNGRQEFGVHRCPCISANPQNRSLRVFLEGGEATRASELAQELRPVKGGMRIREGNGNQARGKKLQEVARARFHHVSLRVSRSKK